MRASLVIGLIWAAAIIAAVLLGGNRGEWTIDDGIKHVAARHAEGVWADRIPDGPVRSRLSDPSEFLPLGPPFAYRVDGGIAPGFSPLTRMLFRLFSAWDLLYRLLPALVAVTLWAVMEASGIRWSFLLMPLTFYGLVPWEHGMIWLLLWPGLYLVAKSRFGFRRFFAASVLFAPAILLRPETSILACGVGAYLLISRRWKVTAAFAAGVAIGLVALFAVHALTSSEPVWGQVGINFETRSPLADLPEWLSLRPEAFYSLLLSMDVKLSVSVLLLVMLLAGAWILYRAECTKKKALGGLGLALIAAWGLIWNWQTWSASFPPFALYYSGSLLVSSPWLIVLLRPPYRGRPLLLVACGCILAAAVLAPVWAGVHWGPRLLLFALPLLVLDLHLSRRAHGLLFVSLLALTAVQTVSSAAIVAARFDEVRQHEERALPRLGSVVVCPTITQCADLPDLWPGREFFVASSTKEFRRLVTEFYFAGVDTFWLHLDAGDSLYVKTFPAAKPVRPHRMTVLQAGTLYKTYWRIYELAMNPADTAWADILQSEAGTGLLAGRISNALKWQREAVKLVPDNLAARHNLALIYAAAGDTASALKEEEIILAADSTLREAVDLVARLRTSHIAREANAPE